MDKNRLIKGRQNGTVSFDNFGFDENDEPKGINDYLNDEEDDDYSNNDNDKGMKLCISCDVFLIVISFHRTLLHIIDYRFLTYYFLTWKFESFSKLKF